MPIHFVSGFVTVLKRTIEVSLTWTLILIENEIGNENDESHPWNEQAIGWRFSQSLEVMHFLRQAVNSGQTNKVR